MTILVIAEHDNASLKGATLNTVSAAAKLGGDVAILVAGSGAAAVAEAAAKVAGVAKVLVVDAAAFADQSAENLAAQVVAVVKAAGGAISHVLAPATTAGKNVLPRVAAWPASVSAAVRASAHTSVSRAVGRGVIGIGESGVWRVCRRHPWSWG